MNELINELYNKIDNQDKIINEQIVEIQELNENITWWQNRFNAVARDNRELKEEKRKVIEYCKREIGNIIANFDYADTKDLENILEVLGDKE